MIQIMDLIYIMGILIILFVMVIIAVTIVTFLDVMSFTAIGSVTLNPAEQSSGRALVVYDPGVSGSAKKIAGKIAANLQIKGYTVDLAGVRSRTAGNVSGYEIIVIGGPTYGDRLGKAAKSYLKNLKISPGIRVGVFATGTVKPSCNDPAYLRSFVTSLPADQLVNVKSVVKLVKCNEKNSSGSGIDTQCSEFIEELLE